MLADLCSSSFPSEWDVPLVCLYESSWRAQYSKVNCFWLWKHQLLRLFTLCDLTLFLRCLCLTEKKEQKQYQYVLLKVNPECPAPWGLSQSHQLLIWLHLDNTSILISVPGVGFGQSQHMPFTQMQILYMLYKDQTDLEKLTINSIFLQHLTFTVL